MKVIIIGSKGFIGHHLYNHCRRNGYEVWGADVLPDPINNEQYFLIDSSFSDYDSAFRHMKYDICINCSGAASVPESLQNPLKDYHLNAVNVFKILDAIQKYQPDCKFLNLSSAAVYGNPKSLPVQESAVPDPLSPYGFHKLQSEQICREFYEFYKIQTCSIRIFSVYGTGLKKQLFWDLYNKAKTGIPFTLFGTGNESRDFISVHDLVKAIELIAEFSDFKSDIINVANGEEILIKDAVSFFFNFFGQHIVYSFSGETREGDPVNWKANISKLNSLGYHPSVDINSGLREYYEWVTVNFSN
jgi:UDP-glucose 4-epimerase